jgi:hypothetical protein
VTSVRGDEESMNRTEPEEKLNRQCAIPKRRSSSAQPPGRVRTIRTTMLLESGGAGDGAVHRSVWPRPVTTQCVEEEAIPSPDRRTRYSS